MASKFKGTIAMDIRDSVPDWDAFLPGKAPQGAPNVLVVLYDDTGCAAWSPYGGRIQMPTMGKHILGVEFTNARQGEHGESYGPCVLYIDVEQRLAAAMARD